MRARHPKKEIEEALQELESAGWRIEVGGGHAWGRAYCLEESRDGCMFSIWSTPKSAGNHAKQILRRLIKCPHG